MHVRQQFGWSFSLGSWREGSEYEWSRLSDLTQRQVPEQHLDARAWPYGGGGSEGPALPWKQGAENKSRLEPSVTVISPALSHHNRSASSRGSPLLTREIRS